MSATITLLEIPATWDEASPVGEQFREYVQMRNEAVTHDWSGDTSHSITPQESWGTLQNQTDEHQVVFVASRDGHPVGRATVEWSKAEAPHIGSVDILVHPSARRTGVGTALWHTAEAYLRENSRSTVQTWIDHFPAEGDVISPPTGFGTVPAQDPGAALAARMGFTLEQVERMSMFSLGPDTQLDELYREALAHAEGYVIDTWTGTTAPADQAELAALHQRMSVDAPSAGLDHEEEQWDVDRLVRGEQQEVNSGHTMLRAIARHPVDGIVAFTTLVMAEPGRPVYQHDTLVHGDHRGHRLGMLVKIANLRQLATLRDEARVITWNAEENRPMLRVNEAIGFTAIGYEGAWQRTITS